MSKHPLWELPFRPFFLFAAAFAAISILTWALYLNGLNPLLAQGKIWPTIWHQHEMIFGFGGLCAMGFLLTAVQNWTGLRSANGTYLALLSLIWIGARLCLAFDQPIASMILQTCWWLGAISLFSALVIRAKSQRNYLFVPVLVVLASLDFFTLNLGLNGDIQLALHAGQSGLLLFVVLMTIVGGRIIPLFTRNATGSKKIQSTPKLDQLTLVFSLLSALCYLAHPVLESTFSIPTFSSKPYLGTLLGITGILHGLRLAHWDTKATLNNAMLWSLHLSYFMMAVGLVAMGASQFIAAFTLSDALHLLAIGAMGGMILSVITRVSLGHTGRAIKANKVMAFAFTLVTLAALARVILPALNQALLAWNLSALMWSLAFVCFVWQFTPILSKERQV